MKKAKKAQVVIFAVLGLVIMIAIVGAIFLSVVVKTNKIRGTIGSKDVSYIESYVEQCLNKIMITGQFYAMKRAFTRNSDFDVELEDYLKSNINRCSDFSKFSGNTISSNSTADVKAILSPSKNLVAQVDWPIRIINNGKENLLRKFVLNNELSGSCCFNVNVDNNCVATESKIINECGIIKNVNVGDSLVFNVQEMGVCHACQ